MWQIQSNTIKSINLGVVEGGQPGEPGLNGLKGERGSSLPGRPGYPGAKGTKGEIGKKVIYIINNPALKMRDLARQH